jgi:hypothetical protein
MRPVAALLLAGLAAAPPAPAWAAAAEDDPNGPSCKLSGEMLRAYGLGTSWADLARMAEDVGAAPMRPDFFRRPDNQWIALCADGPALPPGEGRTAPAPAAMPGPTLDLVPAVLEVSGNTTYPYGGNDGPMWQGRGVNAQLGVGLSFRWGILSAAFVPSVAWQQNADYPIVPTGRPGNLAYANWIYGDALDYPQRFGPSSFWTPSLGQSYVQIAYAGVGLGISTENMWWGPSMRNSILMTNTGAGMPHAYLGTVRPVDIWIGNLEANAWAGWIDRSRYFYTRDPAYFIAFTGDLELRWVRGLYLGATRIEVRPSGCFNCDGNGFIGLWGRWVFPPAGVEVYGEWTRDDAWYNMKDLVREPDHSSGYAIGLQKVFLGNDYWVRLRAEITDYSIPRPPRWWRPNPVLYYTHGGNTNYSVGGQMLGAAIGPDASTQGLDVDVITPSGWYGGYLERVRRNDAWYSYSSLSQDLKSDVEVTVGLRWQKPLGPVDLGATAALSKRWNRDYTGQNEWNGHLGVQLTFWPSKPLLEPPRPAP